MRNISKIVQRAYDFWKKRLKKNEMIVSSHDIPDEYVRKVLIREDMLFKIKQGLYLLKNKGNDPEDLTYQLYWQIAGRILSQYEPYSIEKDSALSLHIGNETIPETLLVRTSKNVKYSLTLPFDLHIHIRPDPEFHKKTCQPLIIGNAQVFIDIPESVLFTLKKRGDLNFAAFIKGVNFNNKVLEVLYYSKPRPIMAKRLIEIAGKCGREDIATILKEIVKKYTVYRS